MSFTQEARKSKHPKKLRGRIEQKSMKGKQKSVPTEPKADALLHGVSFISFSKSYQREKNTEFLGRKRTVTIDLFFKSQSILKHLFAMTL